MAFTARVTVTLRTGIDGHDEPQCIYCRRPCVQLHHDAFWPGVAHEVSALDAPKCATPPRTICKGEAATAPSHAFFNGNLGHPNAHEAFTSLAGVDVTP
jgi:hypothetical protein